LALYKSLCMYERMYVRMGARPQHRQGTELLLIAVQKKKIIV